MLGASHFRAVIARECGFQCRAGRAVTRGIVVPQGDGHHRDTAHRVAQELAVAGLDPQAAAARHHPESQQRAGKERGRDQTVEQLRDHEQLLIVQVALGG